MGIQLSFSAAQRYVLSPLSYFLHYHLRLRPTETGSALVFGAAVDVGLNALLIDKRDGRTPSIEKAKALFDAEFRAVEPTVIKYSKADMDTSVLTSGDLLKSSADPSIPVANLCLLRKGHMILDAYAEQVLPRLEKVILVQHDIDLENELGDKLVGIIDLVAQIDGKIYILDNKTSSVKYAADAAQLSQQLGTYYEALKDEYKIDGVGFIVIPKNMRKKKEPKVPIEIHLGQVDDKVITTTFEMYDNVLDGIKNGRFHCTRNEQNGCCSSPWGCSYKTFCESGGKDLTGLRYEEKKR